MKRILFLTIVFFVSYTFSQNVSKRAFEIGCFPIVLFNQFNLGFSFKNERKEFVFSTQYYFGRLNPYYHVKGSCFVFQYNHYLNGYLNDKVYIPLQHTLKVDKHEFPFKGIVNDETFRISLGSGAGLKTAFYAHYLRFEIVTGLRLSLLKNSYTIASNRPLLPFLTLNSRLLFEY